jgi:hypothetical protein
MATTSAKFIDSVWTSADDQISSQYRISVSIPSSAQTNLGAWKKQWVFRLDKNFTLPTQTANTYETYFNGLRIPRIGAKEETEKKIKLDFRADQLSEIYDFFKNWMDQGFNPIHAQMGSEAVLRKDCNITLELLKRGVPKTSEFGMDEVAKSYTFYHCQPFEVNLTELAHDNGDPIRAEIQFIYLYYDVLGYTTGTTP